MEVEQKQPVLATSSTQRKGQEISRKTEVDTDFLKKILKISNNSNSSIPNTSSINKLVQSSPPKPTVTDKVSIYS